MAQVWRAWCIFDVGMFRRCKDTTISPNIQGYPRLLSVCVSKSKNARGGLPHPCFGSRKIKNRPPDSEDFFAAARGLCLPLQCFNALNKAGLLWNKAGLLENKAGLLENTPRVIFITPKVILVTPKETHGARWTKKRDPKIWKRNGRRNKHFHIQMCYK